MKFKFKRIKAVINWIVVIGLKLAMNEMIQLKQIKLNNKIGQIKWIKLTNLKKYIIKKEFKI